MTFDRIFGLLFSGFAVKAYAAGMAIWLALEASSILSAAMHGARAGLALN